MNETQLEIISQIAIAVHRLGGSLELLAHIGSWGDTINDETTLAMMKAYNENGAAVKEVICGNLY